MKKAIIVTVTAGLLLVLGAPTISLADTVNESRSEINNSPTDNTYYQSVSANVTSFLPGPPPTPQPFPMKEGWKNLASYACTKEVPYHFFAGAGRSRGAELWEKPYMETLFQRQGENKKPINIVELDEDGLPKEPTGRLLGYVEVSDHYEVSREKAIQQALWYAKKFTGATEVAILTESLPVTKGGTTGLGLSLVQTRSPSSKEAVGAGGGGLFMEAHSWQDRGTNVKIVCYERPLEITAITQDMGGQEILKKIEERWFTGRMVWFI